MQLLPSLGPFATIKTTAAVVVVVAVGGYIGFLRWQLHEARDTIAGYAAAIEAQALAAKLDAERVKAAEDRAKAEARKRIAEATRRARAAAVKGTGPEVLNEWLADELSRPR